MADYMFETIPLPADVKTESELLRFLADRHKIDIRSARDIIPAVTEVPRQAFYTYRSILAESCGKIAVHEKDAETLRIVQKNVQVWPKDCAVAVQVQKQYVPEHDVQNPAAALLAAMSQKPAFAHVIRG